MKFDRTLLGCCILILLAWPLSAEGTNSYAFVVVGDTGCDCPGQEKVARSMIEWHDRHPYDIVLMLGDNIYGTGLFGTGIPYLFTTPGGHRDLFESRFDRYYQPLLDRGVRFHATLGNHDTEAARGRHLIEDRERFNILGERGYYPFDSEAEVEGDPLVTFFSLNSDRLVGRRDDPEQLFWLEEALAETSAVWKVVFFHHPLYAPRGGPRPNRAFREAVEEILVEGGVHMTLAGHNHYYARMRPQRGIHHVISGGGGAWLMTPRVNEETAWGLRSYHFVYLEADPERMCLWAVAPDGRLIDRAKLPHPDLIERDAQAEPCRSLEALPEN